MVFPTMASRAIWVFPVQKPQIILPAISSATLASAGNTANLAASAVVSVTSAPVTITLNANDTDAEYSNTAVTVTKLD